MTFDQLRDTGAMPFDALRAQITGYRLRVYEYLLRCGPMTAAQMAERSKQEPQAVAEALAELITLFHATPCGMSDKAAVILKALTADEARQAFSSINAFKPKPAPAPTRVDPDNFPQKPAVQSGFLFE